MELELRTLTVKSSARSGRAQHRSAAQTASKGMLRRPRTARRGVRVTGTCTRISGPGVNQRPPLGGFFRPAANCTTQQRKNSKPQSNRSRRNPQKWFRCTATRRNEVPASKVLAVCWFGLLRLVANVSSKQLLRFPKSMSRNIIY